MCYTINSKSSFVFRFFLVVLLTALFFTTPITADILNVPSVSYPTIRAGISAANAGDTVQVAAGTYYERITLKSDVYVLGAGKTVTTINGSGFETVVTATNVNSAAKFDGFTITNGGNGSGLSSLGGGIYLSNGDLTISNCRITGNTISGTFAYGGGVYCTSGSSATIEDCDITLNTSKYGGGIYINSCAPTISNCQITDNTATGDDHGGGIYLTSSSSSGLIIDCTISDNNGSGVYCGIYSHPTIENCTITGNDAYSGAGINCYSSTPWVVNTVIANNTAQMGGGIYSYFYNPTIVNCVFYNNSADGGSVIYYWQCTPVIYNSVLWVSPAATGFQIYSPSAEPISITYCDVEGGFTGVGNISTNPGFVNAPGGNFHLAITSNCINNGTDTGAPEYDFEGDPRLTSVGGDNVPDMGVDETTYFPNPPSDLQAHQTADRIHLTWQDNSDDETGFRIESKVGVFGSWNTLGTVDPDTTFYQSGYSINFEYFYRVAAFNANGDSMYSNEVSIYTLGSLTWLRLDVPNGGEDWPEQSTQTINWSNGMFPPDYVNLYYSTDTQCTWQLIEAAVPNTGSYSWTVPPEPSDTCLVKVESATSSAMYDLSNAPFTIEPPVPMPDLIVESITTDPLQPIAGQPFNISVTVQNQGTADAGVFWIGWYKHLDSPPTPGQAADEYDSVSSLAADATYTMETTHTYDTPGYFDMYVQVDTTGSVTESDEDNNVFGPQRITVNEFEIIEDTYNPAMWWFGGDDRPGWTRNVGYGQSFTLSRSAHVDYAGFAFFKRFDYYENPTGSGHAVTLVLNIRNHEGTIIKTVSENVPSSFDGGWVLFDVDMDLWAGEKYIYTCTLQDGHINNLNSNIRGRDDNPWPESQGYYLNNRTPPYDMEEWGNWSMHLWDFNFRLAGVYTDRSRADFNADGIVDLLDLRTLAGNWLRRNCQMPDWCEQTDLDWSNTVQFTDFAVFAHHYLRYESGYDYWVDALHGSDSNPGTWDAPFKTISLSLSAAGENKLIKVLPGTYDETLGETFPLMLQPGQILIGDEENKGDGPTPTLIVGYGDFEAGTFKYATMVGAEDSKVSGFKIGTNTKIQLHIAIVADGVTVQISDNTFKANTYGGVTLSNEGTSVIEDNVFDTDSYGIYIRSCMDGPTIQRNAFLSMGIPINVSGCSAETLISENTISGNGQIGIQFGGDAQIDKNTFNRPDGYTYGAIRCSSGNPAIRRNIFICTEAVRIDGGNPDLGTASEHGNNNFSSVTGASVTHNGTATVYAIGNTWPNFPPLFGTDILLNSTADVIWWEELGSGTVTIAEGTGYDFSTGTSGGLSHGDFYYLYQSEEIKFWANNASQRGLQDVGLYDSLNRVQIPTSGYSHSGVPAIAGHMYVSLAEEGEDGCYIMFKVNSADETQVKLTYIYVYAVP